MSGRPAVFLDRDGTIIEDPGYLSDPARVQLLPDSAQAIRQLNQHDFVVVVVTNQSGIARGLFTLEEYAATERQLDQLLARAGARVDAHYFCPHLPEVNGPCDCRKPGSLLHRQAAARFDIDLTASWCIGDRLRDVLPAESFGGRGILVGDAETSHPDATRFPRAENLASAVEMILTAAPHYLPRP